MKTSHILLVLLFAAGYSSLAFAAFAGSVAPALLAGQTAVNGFIVTFLGLIFVADYSRRVRICRVKTAALHSTARERHRLAA